MSPPLEQKANIDDEREVACYLYESAEGNDPYAKLDKMNETDSEDDTTQAPSNGTESYCQP